MNSDIVIRAENISKRYRLSHLAGQGTLRDALHHAARLAWRRVRWNTKLNREDFWALRDVNFEIKRGEIVGVIGRNGAGKSTLLKVLSRITEPSTGSISLRGRVASLLEVGTGFHPELSGRDNIFLNGAILGMTRAEIRRKFDEIVAFAEVERFLDTPVKHYSSGMYVRLAFSVAAHLEPEILIVDEVLAVGDQQFQNKCLGKIKSVARESGRTVLFVSHNLSVIQAICQRCLLFKQGRIIADGPAGESVAAYLEAPGGTAWQRTEPTKRASHFENARVEVEGGATGEPFVVIHATVQSATPKSATLEILLHDGGGQNLAIGQIGGPKPLQIPAGTSTLSCRFPASHLANGRYSLSLRLMIPGIETLDEVMNALAFEFQAPPPAGLAYRIVQAWGGGSFMLDLRRD